MAETPESELDDFDAGFIAGWFRHAGITETPTVGQLAAALEALRVFEAEAHTDVDETPTAPSLN